MGGPPEEGPKMQVYDEAKLYADCNPDYMARDTGHHVVIPADMIGALASCRDFHKRMVAQSQYSAMCQDMSDAWMNADWSRASASMHKRYAMACDMACGQDQSVYLCAEGSYDDYTIIAIFKTREEAEALIAKDAGRYGDRRYAKVKIGVPNEDGTIEGNCTVWICAKTGDKLAVERSFYRRNGSVEDDLIGRAPEGEVVPHKGWPAILACEDTEEAALASAKREFERRKNGQ